MSPCISTYSAKRCEIAKKPTLNEIIKSGYMTKEEAAIYKAAEQNGFNVSVSVDFNIKHNGLIEEIVNIRIEKRKSK